MANTVQVEFFGIPRQRAGVHTAQLEVERLGDALRELAARFPQFGETCVQDGSLRQGYVVNLNGNRFTANPVEKLKPGDVLLILGADAGG